MNFFHKSFLIAALSLSALQAHAIIDNPITQAVIRVYDEQLRANPKDFNTYFRRANEYYRHGEYVSALDDVDNALRFAPASASDLRFQCYMLRAGILNKTGHTAQALADLNSAISLDPNSYAAVYQRANTLFELGQYSEARTDYNRLQRFNSRSIDAIIGQAKCAVKENNLGIATELLDKAVELDPNNPEIYVRRAEVRKLMADHNGAVDDLIVAISLDSKDPYAINGLVEYGNTNYAATIAGLSNAIKLAPNNGLYRYLRATIAQAHYNYQSAIDDFEIIIDQKLYSYHGLYASVAQCLYGLGRYDEALAQIDTALGMTSNVADYYVLRSQILRALGRHDDAISESARALAVDHNNVKGLVEMALNYIDKKDYKEAASLLGEASMAEANDPSILIMRAWLLDSFLNQPAAAKSFFEQALDVEGYEPDDVRSLRGFALESLGRRDEANAWAKNIAENVVDNDGSIGYTLACYYTLTDQDEKALEMTERALKAGYSDNHNWMTNTDGYINMSAIRDDLRFLRLMQKYNYIFGK